MIEQRFKYDTLYFIGRFQPLHNGHCRVIEKALKLSKHVRICIGSRNTARTLRNPFTYEEREGIIKRTFKERVICHPIDDFLYNDSAWLSQVQNIIRSQTLGDYKHDDIGLIGHSKDQSSYYLKMFPGIASEDVPQDHLINATDIRNALFEGRFDKVKDLLPPQSIRIIENFIMTNSYKELCEEYQFVQQYKQMWEQAPFAPTFNTVDSIVVCSGHVLLIQRGINPGKGKWALPGGFLEQGETLKDGAIRELKEETRLDVNKAELYGSITDQHIFDDPYRSARGRTITTGFLINLGNKIKFPKIKAGDDAAVAHWVPIDTVIQTPEIFFEDHWHILNYFVRKL